MRHIAEFRSLTGSEIPWICDTMENTFREGFGGAPNGEFVIDPLGKIVRQRFWSNPVTLRGDLENLVATVENPTSPEDVLVGFTPPQREVASGVVPRIELPGGLMPLVTQPLESEQPFYVKLRVEATRALTGDAGNGSLYLGLYLDPIYRVHWNNRAGEIKIVIKGVDGVEFSETVLTGPEVAVDADVDPRQFLIDVHRHGFKDPFDVSVFYTVCDDAETFCHTIRQDYTVTLKTDRGLGSRPGIFMPGMFAEVAKMDVNQDGRITPDEFPDGKATLFTSHMDRDEDGTIDAAEIELFMSMFNNGRGFDSIHNDGGNPDK